MELTKPVKIAIIIIIAIIVLIIAYFVYKHFSSDKVELYKPIDDDNMVLLETVDDIVKIDYSTNPPTYTIVDLGEVIQPGIYAPKVQAQVNINGASKRTFAVPPKDHLWKVTSVLTPVEQDSQFITLLNIRYGDINKLSKMTNVPAAELSIAKDIYRNMFNTTFTTPYLKFVEKIIGSGRDIAENNKELYYEISNPKVMYYYNPSDESPSDMDDINIFTP